MSLCDSFKLLQIYTSEAGLKMYTLPHFTGIDFHLKKGINSA